MGRVGDCFLVLRFHCPGHFDKLHAQGFPGACYQRVHRVRLHGVVCRQIVFYRLQVNGLQLVLPGGGRAGCFGHGGLAMGRSRDMAYGPAHRLRESVKP